MEEVKPPSYLLVIGPKPTNVDEAKLPKISLKVENLTDDLMWFPELRNGFENFQRSKMSLPINVWETCLEDYQVTN